MDCKTKTYKISNIISSFLLIISYIFVMIQSIINIIYNENNNNDIIAERLVYEQFSHEVYTNIHSKIIKNMTFVDINQDCPENYRIMNFPIKMESFYDCRNIDSDENFEKENFENRITSDQTCFRKGCCLKRISDKKENAYCMDKNKINDDDMRQNLCTKFSKYNGRFYNYENKKICVEKDNINYENLLRDSYDSCSNRIFFDSYNEHYVCNDNNNFNYLTNNNKAIVKNIFSIDAPNFFEMESSIRINKLLNKIKYDEDKIKKEYDKISRISPKNIYDAFMDMECENSCHDYNYINFNNIQTKLNNIFSNSSEIIFDKYRYNSYIGNSDIKWYTRNYIGFKNTTELNKFKKYFDSNDYKENSLYKISRDLFPNYGSFIIGVIICIISITFIILLIKNFKNEEIDIKIKDFSLNNIRFLLVLFLFLAYFIMYLTYLQFDEIYIDMELFYKKVIEKYNERRKQIFLLIGVILFSFNLFIELLIQNLKCDISLKVEEGANGPQINSINAIIKIKDSNCNKKHQFKFYKNKKFSEHMKKIKTILSRCKDCRDYDVDDFYYNDKLIELNKIVKEINIRNNSEIIID